MIRYHSLLSDSQTLTAQSDKSITFGTGRDLLLINQSMSMKIPFYPIAQPNAFISSLS